MSRAAVATDQGGGKMGRKLARLRKATIAVTLAVAVAASMSGGVGASAAPVEDNVVLEWNTALVQGIRESTIGPPMIARALAIAHTSMFDAWAAYDQRAVGTQLGASLRRPPSERSVKNKNEAISYAAYRAAVDLFPNSVSTVFDPLMTALGYDASNTTTDVATPAGIGNVTSAAVLAARYHDGANQLGDTPGGTPGVPYSDYSGYSARNDPMDLTGPFDAATVRDVNSWQPLTYVNRAGVKATPAWLGHHWNRVEPFALTSASQFRNPIGPATFGSAEFETQAADVLALSAGLTDEQKMIAEYWADGPLSETPPGHWNVHAQYVSRRDRHGLGDDVKMFFLLNNALFDAGIAAWDNKVAYDSVRPITAIRSLYEGQTVLAWGGPGQGPQLIDGEDWFPYQTTAFPTPPFAEYVSGHSTFSTASAEILARFTGSDRFGDSVTLAAGSSVVEPGITPAADVTLSWRTFSEAADEAGISRRYGGIHFLDGDIDARVLGRQVAGEVWSVGQGYINGTAQ